MSDHGEYIYIHFPLTDDIIETDTVEAAKALLRQRDPHPHFGEWQEGHRCVSLPVWENTGTRLRYELGETKDKHKPLAYVIVWNLRLRLPRDAKT